MIVDTNSGEVRQIRSHITIAAQNSGLKFQSSPFQHTPADFTLTTAAPGPWFEIDVIAEPLGRYVADGPHDELLNGYRRPPLIYFTSIFVSLGVFLFGYDQGVMSGIITGPHFNEYFNQPSKAQIGTMVAILEIGAFCSSLIVGRVGDIIGRRKTILYGSIIFFVGGALQTIASSMFMMMAGRIVAGFGVGMLSTIVPVYQSEISPPHNRGKLACIEFSGNIIGYTSSVWVDYFCSFINNNMAWRIPLFMQCIMGGLLGLGSLIIVESPRWLLDNDHDEEGIIVIANLYGGGDIHDAKARDEFRNIKMDVLLQRQEGSVPTPKSLAQLNGINVISYYAPYVFESAGWVGRDAILMTGINGITGAVAMVIALSAIALSTATNWAFNWFVGETTPVFQELIHWRLYLVHAFWCAVSFVVVYFLYPETCGVRLEDMDVLFGDASTVAGTPSLRAETDSLMYPGSPIGSDFRGRSGFTPSNAIPGLTLDPPDLEGSEHPKPSTHLYRGLLRAVQYSVPARYVARDQLRRAFREDAAGGVAAAPDKDAIRRTIWFLDAAAKERGLEHKILRNLLKVAWYRRRQEKTTWKMVQQRLSHGKKGPSGATGLRHSDEDGGTSYRHYNMTVAMLNKTMGLCLR
ncbi:unnamed protein product [Parascedosporium putredinis]|uniref:Major facilitator superfamily (MFS) profile domain-containing protein n=1 Tax=Parascedosporium putredinis TaxID=1442378 RepID=A0A9P1MCU0_9PEZI|nr:unnamed protein product [Parascedosporium putredinis]CAI8001290.1 unnamed protein product [Parascedosporium putredinis]